MTANLYSLIAAAAVQAGDRPLLIENGEVTLSYSDLDRETVGIAARLEELGGKPGDRIAVQVEKSREGVLLYLAALRAGIVFVPLNSGYTPAEIGYFLGDAKPFALVCDPAAEAALKPQAEAAGVANVLTLGADGAGSLSENHAFRATFATFEAQATDLAAILYTSGTTGRSKGAMLSHGNLSANALTLKDYWRWQAGDVLLHALPIYHVHGLFVALHGALLNGSTILFHRSFDPTAVIRDLPRATVMMGVPTFYTRLLAHPGFTAEVAANVRLFISGSAPLLESTFAEFEQRTGQRILERYGMTETGMITSNPYEGDRIAGAVGYALPGEEVRICDADGREVPVGEPGVLEVRGPNVFAGYWQMPGKTASEFREGGWFITGDVATKAPDGRVSLVGRVKDLIISGGLNIYPKEIELLLDALPGVGESAVIGVPHPDFGEGVVAVATRNGSGVDEAEALAALSDSLARFKQPKRILFVDQLPRNAMGKVQKAALREAYKDLFQ
jgi:malonyl-CoA/methylmalonyl-CoA synthetase